MNWRVTKIKEGELGFRLVGDGQAWHGRVHQGAMKRDVFWGLKALEYHGCREKVAHPWEIRVPKVYLGQDNAGPHRRYLCFFAPEAAPFVLRFEEYVTPLLLSALREAYSGRAGSLKTTIANVPGWQFGKLSAEAADKESGDEDFDGEAVERPSERGGDGGQGRGDGRAGDAPGHEQDPGDPGLEERRQVARRPAKKAKKRVPKRRARS